MIIYRFDEEVGKQIHQYGSRNITLTPILKILDKHIGVAQIACMYIGAEGIIGGHEAVVPQLLVVVQGEGWVSGSDGVRMRIKQGQIAFWESGEWHETSSELGMTAIIVESDQLEIPKGMRQAVY